MYIYDDIDQQVLDQRVAQFQKLGAARWVDQQLHPAPDSALPQPVVAQIDAMPDAAGLTRAKAYVVLKNPALANEQLADELKHFVKQRLAPYKYPLEVEFATHRDKTAA